MNDAVTDTVVNAASTAASGWFKHIELIIIGLISVALIYSGWYARGVYQRAEVTAVAVKNLKDQQSTDQKQFDHSVDNAKKAVIQDTKNDKLNKEVEANAIKSPLPNCYLPADRIRFINRAVDRK